MGCVFKDKKEKILAIIFSLFYILMLILNIDTIRLPFLQNFRYAINSLVIDFAPLIAPALILIFIFTYEKEYKFKTWLLPIGFGVNLVLSVIALIFGNTSVMLLICVFGVKYILALICSVLMIAAIVLMFIGTLFNFRYIDLFRYGALSYAILCLCLLVIDFINVGGFAYIQSVPVEYPAINIFALVRHIAQVHFYIGVFILTLKKNKDLV